MEEIWIDDPEGDDHGQQPYPTSRPAWWRRLRGAPQTGDIAVFDDAWYRHHDHWPKDVDPRQALVHTGMYMGWLITRDLIRDYGFQGGRGQELLLAFRNRGVTVPELDEQWSVEFSLCHPDRGRRPGSPVTTSTSIAGRS
jgi:hypothetical protein